MSKNERYEKRKEKDNLKCGRVHSPLNLLQAALLLVFFV